MCGNMCRVNGNQAASDNGLKGIQCNAGIAGLAGFFSLMIGINPGHDSSGECFGIVIGRN